MSTDKSFGRKLILFTAAATTILLVIAVVRLMTRNGIRNRNYSDPDVASNIVYGVIYDRNGKILSLDTNGQRTYPYSDHALPTILKAEKVFENIIEPHPGYNEATTYGNNIFLTIDADIQYLLDTAIKQLANYQQFNEAYGMITDSATGDILAIYNDSFVPVLGGQELNLVYSVYDSQNNPLDIKPDLSGFNINSVRILEMLDQSEIRTVEGRYNVFIITDTESQKGINQVIEEIVKGLKSQTKL